MSSRGRLDKKALELFISGLPRYPRPARALEQYETPADLASKMLWDAAMRGDIAGRDVLDLGCGSGRLVAGAVLLGAKRGICLDVDDAALEFARGSHARHLGGLAGRVIYVAADARSVELAGVDTVVMNPPFGVQRGNRGIDMAFLDRALGLSSAVYTLHKFSEGAVELLEERARRAGFELSIERVKIGIPMTFETHRRAIYRFDALYAILRRSAGVEG